jgi:hypothetical protein
MSFAGSRSCDGVRSNSTNKIGNHGIGTPRLGVIWRDKVAAKRVYMCVYVRVYVCVCVCHNARELREREREQERLQKIGREFKKLGRSSTETHEHSAKQLQQH